MKRKAFTLISGWYARQNKSKEIRVVRVIFLEFCFRLMWIEGNIYNNFSITFFEASDGLNTTLSNLEITQTSFFEHQTNMNVFIYWWLNSNTWILASNERKSTHKTRKAFTRFHRTDSNIILSTWNRLEYVHLLVIKLKNLIFGFEWINIEFQTYFGNLAWCKTVWP